MTVIFILTLSSLLQFIAAIMAFRLMPLTGKRLAWSLISAALLLMSLRRVVLLFRMTTDRPDFTSELIGLVISLLMVVGISMITPIFIERKQAEEKLSKSEEKYRELVENANSIIVRWGRNGLITFMNEFGQMFFGCTEKEIIGRHVIGTIVPETESTGSNLTPLMEKISANPKDYEQNINENMRRNGERVWISWTNKIVLDSQGQVLEVLSIGSDITERKRAVEALTESEHKYRLVVENAEEAILIAQDGMLKYVNPVTLRILGYSEEELFSKPLIEIVHPEDREKLLSARIKRMQDEETDPVRQFRVICRDGSVKWGNLHAVAISWKGKPATLNFLTDVTERKKAEEALDKSVELLRTALKSAVQAIAVTVEMRDPYTAGHQRKVADLAQSIATEMNLTNDQIDGIRIGATIHDLGKISVPAEILSKPTELTDVEFRLIKNHPQAGYDILKDMEFPWPIARMVLEHHEKMNGAGYPNGLTGDQCLLESRILSVADIVEAMASHRPYRPGLGIEVALAEIEKNQGTFYDEAVVDACLRLFREKGFKFRVA
jgi:PAS domain S-box-containing protein